MLVAQDPRMTLAQALAEKIENKPDGTVSVVMGGTHLNVRGPVSIGVDFIEFTHHHGTAATKVMIVPFASITRFEF